MSARAIPLNSFAVSAENGLKGIFTFRWMDSDAQRGNVAGVERHITCRLSCRQVVRSWCCRWHVRPVSARQELTTLPPNLVRTSAWIMAVQLHFATGLRRTVCYGRA